MSNRRLWACFVAGVGMAALVWLIIHGGDSQAGMHNRVSDASVSIDTVELGNKDQSGQVDKSSDRRNVAKVNAEGSSDQKQVIVGVYITDEKRVETVALEEYVRGVVAAEMPLEFDSVALEAQALAARTYIVRRLLTGNVDGVPVVQTGQQEEAQVTDTVAHQVYRSAKEMDELKTSHPQLWKKLNDAVNRTENQILTYDGHPIDALFFSASNGYTENSEDVFSNHLPYLRSVKSSWEGEILVRKGTTNVADNEFLDTVEFTLDEFYNRLGIDTIAVGARSADNIGLRVLERTEGHRVKMLVVGDQKFTGVQVREKLGLRSADFNWTIEKGKIRITTHGNGHGVGMSQWGAQEMAVAGKSAEQIVKTYYTGIKLEEVSKFLVNFQSK